MNLTAGRPEGSHGVFPGPLLGAIVVLVDVGLVQSGNEHGTSLTANHSRSLGTGRGNGTGTC